MFNSVHYRYIFSDFSFDDTYMFVPIQFGINVNTKKFSNIHPVYVHSINTNHVIFFISFVYVTHLDETSHMSAEFVFRYGPKCMGGLILPILVLLHL